MIIGSLLIRRLRFTLKPLCVVSIFLTLAACAHSAPKSCRVASDQNAIVTEGVGSAIDQALLSELNEGVFSGAVLITTGNETLLRRGYGCQDQKQGILITPEIISDIGSIAKTFTSVAILLLEERGELNLSDNIGKYFPDAPEKVGKITINQVMLHISGLKNYVNLSDFDPMTRDEAEKKILNRWLEFDPGEKYQYSNAGYTLLAILIERISGIEYQEFIKREFIRPLGLNDTGFYEDELADPSRLAKGYGGWAGRLVGLWGGWRFGQTTHSKKLTWTLMGAGGMVSTVDDMQRWFQALSACEHIPKSVRDKLFTDQLASKKSLGHWQKIKIKGAETIQMNGANVFGYIAKIMHLPEHDITVIVAFNSYSNKYGVQTIHKVTHNAILGSIVDSMQAK
jgi:CubicO group peptidase (beta-lactamase class C family)